MRTSTHSAAETCFALSPNSDRSDACRLPSQHYGLRMAKSQVVQPLAVLAAAGVAAAASLGGAYLGGRMAIDSADREIAAGAQQRSINEQQAAMEEWLRAADSQNLIARDLVAVDQMERGPEKAAALEVYQESSAAGFRRLVDAEIRLDLVAAPAVSKAADTFTAKYLEMDWFVRDLIFINQSFEITYPDGSSHDPGDASSGFADDVNTLLVDAKLVFREELDRVGS